MNLSVCTVPELHLISLLEATSYVSMRKVSPNQNANNKSGFPLNYPSVRPSICPAHKATANVIDVVK